jgi:hypothetical protein
MHAPVGRAHRPNTVLEDITGKCPWVLVMRKHVHPVPLHTRGAERGDLVVAGIELAVVDPYIAVEDVQLFNGRMCEADTPHAAQREPHNEVAAFEIHLASCPHCARDLDWLRRNLGVVADWSSDILSPPSSLAQRLAHRIAEETGDHVIVPPSPQWSEPEWQHVAPGISCKFLASDADSYWVSMLVRLAPGAVYPPHVHAGVGGEEPLSQKLMVRNTGLRS